MILGIDNLLDHNNHLDYQLRHDLHSEVQVEHVLLKKLRVFLYTKNPLKMHLFRPPAPQLTPEPWIAEKDAVSYA